MCIAYFNIQTTFFLAPNYYSSAMRQQERQEAPVSANVLPETVQTRAPKRFQKEGAIVIMVPVSHGRNLSKGRAQRAPENPKEKTR